MTLIATDKYKHCNHHHKLTEDHSVISLDGEDVVVNNEAKLLLQELNRLGLTTRTHHITEQDNAFMSILLDNVEIEIRNVDERVADRTKYNGKKELLLRWHK